MANAWIATGWFRDDGTGSVITYEIVADQISVEVRDDSVSVAVSDDTIQVDISE